MARSTSSKTLLRLTLSFPVLAIEVCKGGAHATLSPNGLFCLPLTLQLMWHLWPRPRLWLDARESCLGKLFKYCPWTTWSVSCKALETAQSMCQTGGWVIYGRPMSTWRVGVWCRPSPLSDLQGFTVLCMWVFAQNISNLLLVSCLAVIGDNGLCPRIFLVWPL